LTPPGDPPEINLLATGVKQPEFFLAVFLYLSKIKTLHVLN